MRREIPHILVLAPDHTGGTSEVQPCFYWYLADVTKRKIKFSIRDETAGTTVFQIELAGPHEKGINRLDLTEHWTSLEPGREYAWFVTLVGDPGQSEGDVFSGGHAFVTKPGEQLRSRLGAVPAETAPWVYAEEGYWYDAFHSLSRLQGLHPKDSSLRLARIDLLRQAGLEEVARYEEQGAR